jgi:hypothetical protein
MVIESVMSQYCGVNTADGVILYLTSREPRQVEAQTCRAARMMGKMIVSSKEFWVTQGRIISHSTFLHGDLTHDSYCKNTVWR